MAKQFYDWQTSGGTDDVMRLVDCLERADVPWCAIGGVAVNHWAEQPMVTQDVDFVVAAEASRASLHRLPSLGQRHRNYVNLRLYNSTSLPIMQMHPSEMSSHHLVRSEGLGLSSSALSFARAL